MSFHRKNCTCCGCTLPGTADTLTVSFRNTNSCAGCYDNNNSVYVNDIDVDIDGDYTLTWASDDGVHRYFSVTGEAITTGELRTWSGLTDCTGADTLLSSGTLGVFARFRLDNGCLTRLATDMDQSGDSGTYIPFFMCAPSFGSDFYTLGDWHATEASCGDALNGGFGCTFGGGNNCVISDATEAKVVID